MTMNLTRDLPSGPLLRFALMLTAIMLAALSLSAAAQASVYGGLGKTDEAAITTGTEGEPGQVDPAGQTHGHAFAADPTSGDFFIADEFFNASGKQFCGKEEKKNYARVQEFSSGPDGHFLGAGCIRLRPAERVGGLAVDSEAGKVYLLIDEERPEEQEIEEELETKEEALARKREKSEPTEPLEKEIQELKARLPLFDSEQHSAAELVDFAIAPSAEKLVEKNLVGRKEFMPYCSTELSPCTEAANVPLLDPTGIAVDPTTHDILIAGQQNEAPNTKLGREAGEETWHAAIQRIHPGGELGPRYVDGFGHATTNCLDRGEEPGEEVLCHEDAEQEPSSPVVTSAGRVFVFVGTEIWELPASIDAGESFSEMEEVKDLVAQPKHLYTLEGEVAGKALFSAVLHKKKAARCPMCRSPLTRRAGEKGASTSTPRSPATEATAESWSSATPNPKRQVRAPRLKQGKSAGPVGRSAIAS